MMWAENARMSQSCNSGFLECDFCKNAFSIHEEKFPRDLYSLMIKYDISQLIWLCATCKKKKDQNFGYVLSLAECQRKMEMKLNNISEAVNQLSLDVHLNGSQPSAADRNPFRIASGFGETTPPSASKSREEWDFMYRNDDSISVRSSNSTSFCRSDSSASTVTTFSLLQEDPNVNKLSLSPPSTNYNGKKALGLLKKILADKIKIDENERKQNRAILTDFLDKLLKALEKGSPEFKQIYNRNYYTGSSYEDLRIGKADEFDINLVLNFPSPQKVLQVQFPEEFPSFARCVLVDADHLYQSNPVLLKLFFDERCLMPNKVRCWMQSLISKFVTVETFERPADVAKIEWSQSGPAATIKLTTTRGSKIDIDLVPVLQFTDPEWPPHCDTTSLGNFELKGEDKFWFLVPKSFISAEGKTPPQCQQLWRMHFPGVEKKFIHGIACVKPLVKLLKLLRDKYIWKILSSYALKTVLMWEIKAHRDISYWKEDLMGDRFIEVLKKLDEYVINMELPHFLYPTVNLIEKMKSGHSVNIHGKIQNIIKEIEKDTSNLLSVFGLKGSL